MDKLKPISKERLNYQKKEKLVLDSFKKDLIQFTDLLDHQRLTHLILPQLNNLNLNKEILQNHFLLMIQNKSLILSIALKSQKNLPEDLCHPQLMRNQLI